MKLGISHRAVLTQEDRPVRSETEQKVRVLDTLRSESRRLANNPPRRMDRIVLIIAVVSIILWLGDPPWRVGAHGLGFPPNLACSHLTAEMPVDTRNGCGTLVTQLHRT
eukprot:1326952-Amorphochlora_amoeboformis.AAC.1